MKPFPHRTDRPQRSHDLRRSRTTVARTTLAAVALAALASACGSNSYATPNQSPPAASTTPAPAASPMSANGSTGGDHAMSDHTMSAKNRAAVMLATAAFQDVASAQKAGYASSLDSLGCFQDPHRGGMGLHYINPSFMDATVDAAKPEALVYELDDNGAVAGLGALEYIVPIDAWKSTQPPQLFGVDFHKHPTLPLWVLHVWLWKDNPNGIFQDWNPATRLCPAGVPVFGVDLTRPAQPAATSTTVATAPDHVAAPEHHVHAI